MPQFDHEKLDVYHVSLAFSTLAGEIATVLAAQRTSLADQLRRAAFSITRNVAEGAGETKPKEKARIYRIASRSGNECAAVLDISAAIGAIDPGRQIAGKEMLVRIVSMLIRLCQSLEAREREESGTGTGTRTGEATGTPRKPR